MNRKLHKDCSVKSNKILFSAWIDLSVLSTKPMRYKSVC